MSRITILAQQPSLEEMLRHQATDIFKEDRQYRKQPQIKMLGRAVKDALQNGVTDLEIMEEVVKATKEFYGE